MSPQCFIRRQILRSQFVVEENSVYAPTKSEDRSAPKPVLRTGQLSEDLSAIVFLASGKVDVEQARRLLRFRRGRRVSSDLLKRFARRLAAHDLGLGPAPHLRIQHFEGAATGIDLVIVRKIREPFEHPEQVVVPGATQDLHIAGAALRAKRSEPCQLVTALRGRPNVEATECAHQVKRLGLAGLPRILAEPDADPFAILRCGVFLWAAEKQTVVSSRALSAENLAIGVCIRGKFCWML